MSDVEKDGEELETPAVEDASGAETPATGEASTAEPTDSKGSSAEAPPEPEPESATDASEVVDEDEDAADDDADAEAPAERSRRLRRRRGAKETEVAKPEKPAPARRKARRDPSLPIPVVRAQAKYVRSSSRKARLVCDNIRGKSVEEARAILALTPRAIARDWSKLLESAVANAEHNHELVGEDLYVKAVHADEGPTIKRFQPRAMGRATKIRKRTSHLTILLTPKD
jgi:ribosomal protein L22